METKDKCKYCGYEGLMKMYVKFFKPPYVISNPNLPRYNFHYGSECPKCGRWLKWENQTDKIMDKKFYEDDKQEELFSDYNL